ncbi:U-box domain-containing protein 62 [Glycine soja]
MVAIMQQQQQQQQQQQNPSALVPFQLKNPQSSTTTAAAATPLRSPSAQSQLSSPLSVVPPLRQSPLSSHPVPVTSVEPALTAVPTCPLVRVRLSDIAPYEGAPAGPYLRAMEALCGSLLRHNAALIELGNEDTALMRCGLEGARLFFRSRAHLGSGKGSRGVYMYRAGRALEDWDSSPPCMADIFKCMGKASRSALSAIARHLRLRSDFMIMCAHEKTVALCSVFNHLLDDAPLPANEVSSSVLVVTYSHASLQNGRGAIGGGKPPMNGEVEKGLLTLISSDTPGLQVCDPSGRWYLADSGSVPGDLLLITGKALTHATAGLCPAASYRASPDYFLSPNGGGRTSLAYRLMPQGNAILDCSPIAAAGHVIPQSYVRISVSQFMDDLAAEELIGSRCDNADAAAQNNVNKEPSLRSVLSDPLSGTFLEDAMLVSCGHSFGGLMLRRVIETSRCTLCNAEIETGSLIPNHALRAAAAAVKHEDDRRLFRNAALRKRRKEMGDQMDSMRRVNRENGDFNATDGLQRGVQYPFSVNEKVVIKGNRRTPEKFVGKEAVITSQCLNGCQLLLCLGAFSHLNVWWLAMAAAVPMVVVMVMVSVSVLVVVMSVVVVEPVAVVLMAMLVVVPMYLLKIIETGENVRLQYRSLRKILNSPADQCPSQPIQNSSS